MNNSRISPMDSSRQNIIVIVDRKRRLVKFIDDCISGTIRTLDADVHLLLHERIPEDYVTEQFQRIDKANTAQMAAGEAPSGNAPHIKIYANWTDAELSDILP